MIKIYSKKLIQIFRNPKFAREMRNPDGIGEIGNVRCGDIMKIFIKVKDDVIKDISFQTYGCMAAIAASDMMCKLAKGKNLNDAMKISYKEIVEQLGEMPKIKYHCSVLGTQALKKAIKNYKEKK